MNKIIINKFTIIVSTLALLFGYKFIDAIIDYYNMGPQETFLGMAVFGLIAGVMILK